MKHLFLVHSSITYYMSVVVVKSLGLSTHDVIFLFYGNYEAPNNTTDITYIDISNYPNFPHPLTIQSIIKSQHIIKLLDKSINHISNNKNYIVYISTTSTLLNQIFITNDLCRGYHFIEEGVANYRDNLYNEPAIKRNKLITIMCSVFNLFHSRISLNYPFLKPYKKFSLSNYVPKYFLLDNKYHSVKNRSNIVLLPFYKESDENHRFDYSNSIIFVMSPLLEYRLCSIENLRCVISYFFSQVISSEQLFVKYHPQQNTQTKDLVLSIALEHNIAIKEIDLSLPMEQVLLHSDNSKWYGFESSLLFYASLFNQSVQPFSLSTILSGIDSKYASWLNTLPSIILEASTKLKIDDSK